MNKKTLALFLVLSLLMSGCAMGSGGGEVEGARFYRVENTAAGSGLVRENTDKPVKTVEKMLSNLNARPSDSTAPASLPEGVNVGFLGFNEGIAEVEMSPEYLSLKPREKLLTEAAVVLSLSTLDSVCYVDISCDKDFIGSFGAEDFLEVDAMCGGYERIIKLYLPDSNSEFIRPRSISLVDKGEADAEELILQQLFKNIENGMENTKILSVTTENGVCKINLSEEFYGAEPAGSMGGMVIIYSMVNSLCRLKGVDAVHIKVEGNEVTSYGGFIPMWPLSENMGLVRYE